MWPPGSSQVCSQRIAITEMNQKKAQRTVLKVPNSEKYVTRKWDTGQIQVTLPVQIIFNFD